MFSYVQLEQKKATKSTVQKKEHEKAVTTPNQTGIPNVMKTRFEDLSSFSLDDVRVHYNSGKPAELQALAYTQRNQVYVAPKQEKHLVHELEHESDSGDYAIQKANTSVGVPINDCLQLKRTEVSVQGLTHMVRKNKENSIFDGQEIPPPFGQLEQDERLVIDNEKIIMSRRGIHQEVSTKRESDKVGSADKRWYQILKVKGVETDDKGFYIREGTFHVDKEQTNTDVVSVDDIRNLLNNVLPMWANIHRALELEANEFKMLQKLPFSDSDEKVKLSQGVGDNIVIADLLSTMSPSGKRLHLGSMKTERSTEGNIVNVRVYLTIISAQEVKNDIQPLYTKYKDIQHDKDDDKVKIYGTEKAGAPSIKNRNQVIFFNIGKPARAYAWVEKYMQQEGKRGIQVYPVVRSFLVPLVKLQDILLGASNEHDKPCTDVANVDFDRAGNQFAMKGAGLQLLQDEAIPGSLISYTDGIDALDDTSGTVCSLSVLRGETGIPDIKLKKATLENDDPKDPGFRPVSVKKEDDLDVQAALAKIVIEKSESVKSSIIEGSKKKRPSSMVADELQNYYAHWVGKESLLTVPTEKKLRKAQVLEFLNQQYIKDSKYSEDVNIMSAINQNIKTVLAAIDDSFHP